MYVYFIGNKVLQYIKERLIAFAELERFNNDICSKKVMYVTENNDILHCDTFRNNFILRKSPH